MTNIQKFLWFIWFLCSISIIGCTFEKTTYVTLNTMGIAYESIMKVSADLYKDKQITEEQKDKIIELGTVFYGSYHTLVEAFELYKMSQTTEVKKTVTIVMAQTVKSYNNFVSYYNDTTKSINTIQQWETIKESN